MIAVRIGRDWKTFGYSSAIFPTCWRSRAEDTQGSVGERTYPLPSLSEPRCPRPSWGM